MKPSDLDKSPLQKHFIEFYNEIVRQKEKIAVAGNAPVSGMDGSADLTAGTPVMVTEGHPIFATLYQLFEKQVLETRSVSGEYGVTYYRQAQYIMAALADEVFLNLDWDGREQWKINLLEFKLFKTSAAGEQFFIRLEKLLKDSQASDKELASIYFLALSLGFKGKYRDTDDQSRLDFYRRQLFTFLFQQDPQILDNRHIWFEEAYASTFSEGGGGQMPYLRWWVGALLVIAVGFIAVSHAIWIQTTMDLVSILEKINLGI